MSVCLRNLIRRVKKLSYTSQKIVLIKIIFTYRETHINSFVHTLYNSLSLSYINRQDYCGCVQFLHTLPRGEFRPRQTRQLPRAVDLKGWLLSCQNY